MEKTFLKTEHRIRRHKRIRAKISGNAKRPRLCIFRSNQHIYAQLIDDAAKKIIGVVSDFDIKTKKSVKDKEGKEIKGKIALSFEVGEKIASLAKEKGISEVVFDRGGYQYHGRIKALAEGARTGLKF
ncbi:MAG: 50S ribosomal protein L18 [Candidatus Pacebacteria bacterium]|nr:50S ribosomal protein L18 [Candidatus Paceibacterota bacterium]